MRPEDVAWVERYAAGLAPAGACPRVVSWVETSSGAAIAHLDGVVAKVHAERTDVDALQRRLALVAAPGASGLLVQPLTSRVVRTPVGRRAVTVWPAVTVLSPNEPEQPWTEAGRLLARLHRVPAPTGAPVHGGPERLVRAVARCRRTAVQHGGDASHLVLLGTRLEREVREALGPAQRHTAEGDGTQGRPLVHGDLHLGQLAVTAEGLRLLDPDDLGVGDPAWDLARPAGFWAAGVLDDAAWTAFLDGYRQGAGPAVPPDGDPWPALDLPARCAVFVATVSGRGDALERATLLAACRRM